MKKYYIEYTRDFANTYNLYWADESNAPYVTEGMERITRAVAINMAQQEAWRRKNDQAMSGFATDRIYPVDFDSEWNNPNWLWENGKCRYILEWESAGHQKRAHKEAKEMRDQM